MTIRNRLHARMPAFFLAAVSFFAGLQTTNAGDEIVERETTDTVAASNANSNTPTAVPHAKSSAILSEGMLSAAAELPATPEATIASYEQLREQLGDSNSSHRRLAKFCREEGMTVRSRAHLLAAAATASSLEEWHALSLAAGQQIYHGTFLGPTEIRLLERQVEDIQRAKNKWRSRIDDILRDLESDNELLKRRAVAGMKHISGPGTPSIVTTLFLGRPPRVEKVGLEHLLAVPTVESSEAIATFATDSQWPSIRERATVGLAKRKPSHYVPLLLARLWTTPVLKTSSGPSPLDAAVGNNFPARSGGETFNSVSTIDSEGQHFRRRRTNVLLLDVNQYKSRIGATRFGGGLTREELDLLNRMNYVLAQQRLARILSLALLAPRDESQTAELLIARRKLDRSNERIYEILSCTQPVKVRSPQEAWDWWAAYNGLSSPKDKDAKVLVEVVETEARNISQPIPRVGIGASCFSAGTMVWTDQGTRPIESLRTGDLVLSQHVDTGELMYSPVLRPTSRYTKQQFDLSIGNAEGGVPETIRSSGGHPFWVSGYGWKRVNHVESGEVLHTLTGSVRLTDKKALDEESEEAAAPVYNLIVDQSHTYFVGDNKLLVHDDTIPRRVDQVVPGYTVADLEPTSDSVKP